MLTPMMQGSLRVLLVEDHADIAANVCDSFAHAGHVVDYAASSEQALSLVTSNSYDVLVVDVMLPGANGIDFCRTVRDKHLSPSPVLMLTARLDLDDKIDAFNAGADDYLTKPFAMRELLARCMVLSRRGSVTDGAVLSLHGVEIDTAARTIARDGVPVKVTPTGYRILLALVRAAPAVMLRDDLEQIVWGDERPESDALRTHLSVLRSALDRPFGHPLIHTVHGAGWTFRERVT